MRLVLLAVLLASLAGCEHRYEAVATEKDVYVLDKKTGQVLRANWTFGRGGYAGEFGLKPKYSE